MLWQEMSWPDRGWLCLRAHLTFILVNQDSNAAVNADAVSGSMLFALIACTFFFFSCLKKCACHGRSCWKPSNLAKAADLNTSTGNHAYTVHASICYVHNITAPRNSMRTGVPGKLTYAQCTSDVVAPQRTAVGKLLCAMQNAPSSTLHYIPASNLLSLHGLSCA